MIKDRKAWEEFEREYSRGRKPDFYKNLAMVNELHRHALKMGVFGKDPLDGIEVDLRVARIINHILPCDKFEVLLENGKSIVVK